MAGACSLARNGHALIAIGCAVERTVTKKEPQAKPMLMKAIKQFALTAFAAAGLWTLNSYAELVSGSDPRFGPDSITLDSRTGLAWLDLTFTTNLSYNQLVTGLQPGGRFAGFRFATPDEVLSLYTSAGFGEGYYLQGDPPYGEVASPRPIRPEREPELQSKSQEPQPARLLFRCVP